MSRNTKGRIKKGRRSRRSIAKSPVYQSLIASAKSVRPKPLAPSQNQSDALSAFQLAELLPPSFAQPQPDQTVGEFILEMVRDIVVAGYKHVWIETDPSSYRLYQATFTVAPYWPRQQDWALNGVALGSAAYGFVRVKERVDRILAENKSH